MDAKEIAKELTEAVLARAALSNILGRGVNVGDAEKYGKKIGELYKGILAGVVNAIRSAEEKEPK